MPDFTRPWVLLLFIPLLVIIWRRYRHPSPFLRQALPRGWGMEEGPSVHPPLPWAMRMGALGLLVVALAGPTVSAPLPSPPGEGVAIMVALDLSGSMDTPDLGGRSRLGVAREEVARFVRARPGDLMGLVTFGEEAVTRVPPTTHHPRLLEVLAGLEVAAGENGTALGTGLGLATQRISRAPSPSRVVVLLTDGRHNTGSMEPLPVARAAGELDVRVHTVGLGRPGGEDPLDEPLLREISHLTGGRYFPAEDRGGFERVLAEIDAMEKGPLPPEGTLAAESRHAGFLMLGVLLLVGESLLWMAPGGRIR